MLHLQLGNDPGFVVQPVLVAQHKAAQVGLRLLAGQPGPGVVDLTVAGQHGGGRGGGGGHRGGSAPGGSGSASRSGVGAGAGRSGIPLLLHRAQLGLELAHLGGQVVQPAHQLGFGGGLGVSGADGPQQGQRHGGGGQRLQVQA